MNKNRLDAVGLRAVRASFEFVLLDAQRRAHLHQFPAIGTTHETHVVLSIVRPSRQQLPQIRSFALHTGRLVQPKTKGKSPAHASSRRLA